MLAAAGAKAALPKLAEEIFEHGAVQSAFVAEIVVEHGLVRVRGRRDFFGAGAGHSLGGEMLLGGGQNSPGRPGFSTFFRPRRISASVSAGNYLTN